MNNKKRKCPIYVLLCIIFVFCYCSTYILHTHNVSNKMSIFSVDFFQRWLRQVFIFFVFVPNYTRWHQKLLLYHFSGSIWEKGYYNHIFCVFLQKALNIIDRHLHGLVCLFTKVCRVLTVSLDTDTSPSNPLKRGVV